MSENQGANIPVARVTIAKFVDDVGQDHYELAVDDGTDREEGERARVDPSVVLGMMEMAKHWYLRDNVDA